MGTVIALRPREDYRVDGLQLVAGGEALAPSVTGGRDGEVGLWLMGESGGRSVPTRRRASPAVRRRRLVVAAVGLAVLLLAFPPGGTHPSAAGSSQPAVRAGTVYTVRPGDTLWSIAERLDPSGDPRPLVQQMAADSGSYTIVPGERLSLP